MSKNNNNTPRLRLPEFSGEWKEKKISDLFKISRGYVLPTSATRAIPDEEYKYPVYSSQTTNNGLMGFYNKALYKDAITWTTDGANAGTVKYRKGEFYCTNVCGVLTSAEGYANLCVAEILGAVTKNHVSYVGNPKLMNNVMAEIAIFIPPTPEEQKKIADCLSEMDNLISAQAQKVELLKDQKKGMMQELFPQKGETTPRLRFPEFTGEWVEKKLSEITERVSVGLATSVTPYYRDKGVVMFRNLNIKPDFLDDSDILYLDETFANANPAKKIHTDDVLTVHTGYVGISCVVPPKYDGALTFTTLVTTTKKADLNPHFLSSFLNSNEGAQRITVLQAGCGRNNLNVNDFILLQVPLPPTIGEQQKIANCLSELDDLIASETKQLEALKDHKKGLMQQLFPQPAK